MSGKCQGLSNEKNEDGHNTSASTKRRLRLTYMPPLNGARGLSKE